MNKPIISVAVSVALVFAFLLPLLTLAPAPASAQSSSRRERVYRRALGDLLVLSRRQTQTLERALRVTASGSSRARSSTTAAARSRSRSSRSAARARTASYRRSSSSSSSRSRSARLRYSSSSARSRYSSSSRRPRTSRNGNGSGERLRLSAATEQRLRRLVAARNAAAPARGGSSGGYNSGFDRDRLARGGASSSSLQYNRILRELGEIRRRQDTQDRRIDETRRTLDDILGVDHRGGAGRRSNGNGDPITPEFDGGGRGNGRVTTRAGSGNGGDPLRERDLPPRGGDGGDYFDGGGDPL